MVLFNQLIGFATLWSSAFSASLDKLSEKNTFSVDEAVVLRARPWSGFHSMRLDYIKHGLEIPAKLEEAVNRAAVPGQTSVLASPLQGDREYNIKVQVGSRNFTLELDTGSSDMWIRSVLIPESKRTGTSSSRFYDPKNSQAKAIQGGTWQISYGDGERASGEVFIDKVAVGGLVVPNQAVGAAKTASPRLIKDPGKDGILGLGFSRGSSFKPAKQLTWFDNIRPRLAAPLFTASLKRGAPGTYDFGYIDPAKYKGDIVWSPVKPSNLWGLRPSGFAIGNGPVENLTFAGIADTGTSLMYLPSKIVQKYWTDVKGAKNGLTGDWQFPCNAMLPDLSIIISDKRVVVPGINMKYVGQAVGGGYCLGGLQNELKNLRFSILGAVFHKGRFVVYDAPIGGQPRLGFAEAR